ncbi:uncharacterized protein LOC133791984 [Humulus lupulus]|uniref:uncharacterized protein LOC133791984 n=1 Tax=Humulus lupulus TaxID=3486 RepID=UPI002B40629E|nr:uncharacterized protein LOC133791984 [Humulus lupulus]
MVEVSITQAFPHVISFINELDQDIEITVNYEWLPILCEHCKGMGHKASICKKKRSITGPAQQTWVPKTSVDGMWAKGKKQVVAADGFQKVVKGKKVQASVRNISEVNNSFGMLDSRFDMDQEQRQNIDEGEIPLSLMDRILCWNVRGINNHQKHAEIKKLINSKKIGLVSLLETKVKNKNIGVIYNRIYSGWCFMNNNPWVDKGRIMVAWNPCMYIIDIRVCTSQLIHCMAQSPHLNERFYITFVYGFNDEVGREMLWQELTRLASNIDEAWMILGDFNEILHSNERVGKKANKKPYESLRDCLLHCQMDDPKYSRCFYTWNNKQQAKDKVCSKIDRAVVNLKWTYAFLNSEVVFLPEGAFDHSPILVSFY